ncbi:multiheme c-type cytochrome [Aliidiomarina haloalkalitolerans]|uniref:Uncharacterized protein n=1 Tax=Aliidiomarina haloalkalitolerans TaxID=859059 RepID=A0A432VT08_9GAMM|nr:multiheme c-type cytochrome [Aliidiomarina haloalkalitolerans]MCL4410454.1 hypothetical protein [Gammaproteobacteria bacterium]RUO19581.1 hypothetical protein CWE06_08605 [Aliidiomarina haloalkalitolerans]
MLSLRWLTLGLIVLALIFTLSLGMTPVPTAPSTHQSVALQWVDETTCQQCHLDQVKEWQGSHHQLAMLQPDTTSVRGPFNGTQFQTVDESFLFFNEAGRYFVETQKRSGTKMVYPVAYTFGWEPLQQYLIETEPGRLQALSVAWDTEREQWFHLYEGAQVDATHPLHWQQRSQNANTQCIECHTSGYSMTYSPKEHRMESQWQSLGVGCQACHGQASHHLAWAQSDGAQAPDHYGFSRALTAPEHGQQQLETCAQCHSRRTPLGAVDGQGSFHDDYLLSLLTADLYEVDGQISDEVFEYGSFLQSKMYQQGVVCSDCHNPHSAQFKMPEIATCTQCHNPTNKVPREGIQTASLKAANYAGSTHHFHQPESSGADCRSCHMPSKTYMGNDVRHDHSFSVPNPTQALTLGHSDACLSCHTDDDPEIIITAFTEWYPDFTPRDGGYAVAMYNARGGQAGAVEALLQQLMREDLPPIRRAALLAETPHYPAPQLQQQAILGLQHDDPLVRRSALNAVAEFLPPDQLQQILTYLQADPVRSIRVTATELAVEQTRQTGQPMDPSNLTELIEIQQKLAGRPEAHYTLATLLQLQPMLQPQQVSTHLSTALRLAPDYTPALVAQAELIEQRDSSEGLNYLRQEVERWPNNADLQFALALAEIRNGDLAAGTEWLIVARQRAPENDYYAYVLAIAWHDQGQIGAAKNLLREQLEKNQRNRQLRLTLLNYLDANDESQAEERVRLIEQWSRQNPNDALLKAYLRE